MLRGFAGYGTSKDACAHRVQSDFGKLVFMRVADHRTYAPQGGDFFCGTLGVAAGDYDPGLGIFSMNAADRSAGVPVGSGGYGAGVEDDDSGLGGVGGAL